MRSDLPGGTGPRVGAEVHYRTCPLCEAMCGLEVRVHARRVLSVRPDPDDVWSKGYICPKGAALGDLHHDPDRLRVPLIRDGSAWREVTWPQALARCDELLHGIIARHGRDAITAYLGNPVAHSLALSRYAALFIGLSQLKVVYSAGTVDQWPKNVACMLMYGSMWTIPTPDIQRTDYWLIMGANPAASQGSLLACPDVLGEIDRIQARGGRVVVMDPRRTGTATRADEWVAIRPGTDAPFLLAVVHVLFADGLVDLGDVADIVTGLDTVRSACAPFTPERVERACAVPAQVTRRIAHEIAAARAAAVYGRIGLCTQEFGTLASWLVDVVNILTGNFDRPGGVMFANPIAWSLYTLPDPQWMEGVRFGRWRSRVRGIPEVLGQFPVSCLAEEIDAPGPGQLQGLITIAGNPVISTPNAARLDRALSRLECMISVDNYLNETTRHAHVILPGLSPFEQPHFDDLVAGWAVRSAGNFSPAIFAPPEGQPHEWEILARLAAMLAGVRDSDVDVTAIDDGFFSALCMARGIDAAAAMAASEGRGPLRLLDFQIRTGAFGDRYGERPDGLTLQSFRERPHGIDCGPMVPRVRELLATPLRRIELAPAYITADVPRLLARLDRDESALLLVSRRHLRSNNSWMHNITKLVGDQPRCTLLMHPDDAATRNVEHGTRVRVTSAYASVEVALEVSDEMMPGVVSLPHGWGHDRPGTRLTVAREHVGVNSNLLAPPDFFDPISNNAAVNGIPVEVTPVT